MPACASGRLVRAPASTRVALRRAVSLPRRLACRAASDSAPVVVPGDARLGVTLGAVALFLGSTGVAGWVPPLVHGALGGFLAFQATRIRFRFSEDALQVVKIEPLADDATAAVPDADLGDNKLQGGGQNSWSFASVTNWEFWWCALPTLAVGGWWGGGAGGAPPEWCALPVAETCRDAARLRPGFPVLVYYKETQTRPDGRVCSRGCGWCTRR